MLGQQPDILPFISIGLELVFYITVLVLVVYTLFLSYHWFSYGTSKKTALLSLAVFLLGSTPLVLIMAITI